MPDSCIVTLASSGGQFEVDLDVPSETLFAELKDSLLLILKALGSPEFDDWRDMAVMYDGFEFADNDTLMKVGAFDGSVLIVSKK